jgi:uncharacterized damage-inducible protein DinB
VLEAVKSQWTDATLDASDAMYGQMWKRGYTLTALIFHQIHHRGQMTVLMRQAGLPVPGFTVPHVKSGPSGVCLCRLFDRR